MVTELRHVRNVSCQNLYKIVPIPSDKVDPPYPPIERVLPSVMRSFIRFHCL